MFSLNKLDKLQKKRKRIGRGGDRGGTSGQGHKGQKARSGGKVGLSFEGGQMPLSRRIPKRGFNNKFRKDVRILNLQDLESKFENGDSVNRETLRSKGIVTGKGLFFVKLLGSGKLSKALTVQVDLFSKSAQEAVKKAGGNIQKAEGEASDSSPA